MFDGMFDELKEVKYFNEIADFKSLIKTFEELSKNTGVFRTQVSIFDGAFFWKHLMAYYFRNKSSIIDVRLSYIYASENIEIFKVKLNWRKSSRLLQRVAFLVEFTFTYPQRILYLTSYQLRKFID